MQEPQPLLPPVSLMLILGDVLAGKYDFMGGRERSPGQQADMASFYRSKRQRVQKEISTLSAEFGGAADGSAGGINTLPINDALPIQRIHDALMCLQRNARSKGRVAQRGLQIWDGDRLTGDGLSSGSRAHTEPDHYIRQMDESTSSASVASEGEMGWDWLAWGWLGRDGGLGWVCWGGVG